MRARALSVVVSGCLLAGCLVAAARPVHGAHLHSHRGLRAVMQRSDERGGCCNLRLNSLTPDSASVTDQATGFGAMVERVWLTRGQVRGFATLWLDVTERNQSSAMEGFDSGPNDWLLQGDEALGGTYAAVAAVPPRIAGLPLIHVDSLHADTNPVNEGWIAFHLPVWKQKHYTLMWSDCMPGCGDLPMSQAYAALVDVSVVPA